MQNPANRLLDEASAKRLDRCLFEKFRVDMFETPGALAAAGPRPH
jgi:hypothetical protein